MGILLCLWIERSWLRILLDLVLHLRILRQISVLTLLSLSCARVVSILVPGLSVVGGRGRMWLGFPVELVGGVSTGFC